MPFVSDNPNLGDLVRGEIARTTALEKARELFEHIPQSTALVWDFFEAPEELRFMHSDDRDFLILTNGSCPHWSWKLAVCDEEDFQLGGGFVVTVTSHA